jgi:2'-5' RNA ligase
LARRRLGAALVLDPPAADEVDGLRRALGDRARTRIVPHLTLISPVNVRADDLPSALALLRDAAAAVPGPLELTLGPPATFLPDNPVLYLPVGGDVESLARMRAALFVEPLARPLGWPWVPHVTLADDAPPERISAATAVLDAFELTITCDRVVLLEEQHGEAGRRWVPLADALLGPRTIVGRGGLPLELTTGHVVDPEAEALLDGLDHHEIADNVRQAWLGKRGPGAYDPFPLLVVARREGSVVGIGAAWYQGGRGYLRVAVDAAQRGQGIGRHTRAELESRLAASGWGGAVLD